MLIAIDITPLQTGHRFRGIGSYTRGLLGGLASLDTDDRFILYAWNRVPLDLSEVDLPRQSTICTLSHFPGLGRASALVTQQVLMLPHRIRLTPDIFHQLGIVADPTAGGLPWHLLGHSVVTVHDLTPLHSVGNYFAGKRLRRIVYAGMLYGARHCRRVITDSAASADDIRTRLDLEPNSVAVVPLAVDVALHKLLTQDMPPDTRLALPSKYILMIGGDLPNKRLDTLLDAFALADVSRVSLVVIGPSGPNLARFAIRQPELGAKVFRFEHLGMRDLAAVYRRAALVVVPSEIEGFGLPVIEAMTAGVPTVCSDAPSLVEIAGGASASFPRGDCYALAKIISRLLRVPVELTRLSKGGRDRSREFDWKRSAELTYDVYDHARRSVSP